MELDAPPSPPRSGDVDICSEVLSKFSNPKNERHLHICAAIGAMSQELKDQNLPLTAVAYFGATCSSLERLLSSTIDPPLHLVDSLLSILSLVIHRFNNFPAVLERKYNYMSEPVMKILQAKSVEVNVIVQALKLALPLLTLRHKVAWIDISQLYGVVLGYITDDRSQVRRCAAMTISEVLQKFRSVPALGPLLAPASEAITNVFERFLLLAGGSNRNDPEQTKGAQEVLYVLDTLKTCLPFMSSNSLNKILKHYKSLMDIKQTLVTRRITDALNNLCRHNVEEVDGELLVDLLCSIASMLSPSESSADSMTFTARLLGNGMKTVYLLDRQICVVKLPVVFSALTDVLTSGHEEPMVEAVKTYIDLIHTCVDENLIKQGVGLITDDTATMKSGVTVIEKLCATTKSLLHYRYESIWNMSFQIVSTMFEKLGDHSYYLFKGALWDLAGIQKLRDGDFTFRKQLHECVGAALRAMGPENFLDRLPLNLEVEDMSEANLWLFPILKQYIVGANLRYFKDSVLPMIEAMKRKSTMLNNEGNMYSARSIDGIVYSLWSLFPSFCNYPTDTSESFKGLVKALCTALHEEPDVRAVICSSLQILIQQNKTILDVNENNLSSEVSNAEERSMALYTSDVANANLGALRSSARELLSVLSAVHFKASKDISGIIQKTIGDFASIVDKKVVSRFFRKTMEKLLKVTQEDAKTLNSGVSDPMNVDNVSQKVSLSIERAQVFDLAVSLLPGLNSEEIDMLLEPIKPALGEANGFIQKKAYRVLSLILKLSDDYTSRKLEEMRHLMIEVLPHCHISAKRHRLDCLYFLIIHDTEEGRHQTTVSFLTEIILALKEANKKTRNRAYEILVHIGHAYEDDENGSEKGNLHKLFNMVAGGLAGETPHMISAAMKGLARLAYEFSDLVSAAYDILPSTFLLLQRKNKEIIKANLGLLKVLVAKSQAEGLHTHLRSMVECLLNWQDSTKNHFKAKVKLLLEMLVNKCGLDAVKEVMPEEHMKLLTNIRKLKERKERNRADRSIESRSVLSKATTSRMSKWNHTKIFSDIDDEETMHGAGRQNKFSSAQRLKRKRGAGKSLQEDLFDQSNDDPLDLLDGQRTSTALRSTGQTKKSESDDEPEMDSEGRLIIHEEGKRNKDKKPKREMDDEAAEDGRSVAGSHLSRGSRKDLKRRKTSEAGWAYAGKEYASKKAAGDIKRKDKLEPYAYWPLDRKMVSRRPEHRAAARKGMAQVVKLTKKLEGQSVKSALSMKGAMFKKGKKKGGNKKR